MAEQLVNEFTVNRPIDEAWPVICDLERIAPCLPGAQLQEIEGDEYRGIVKVKLGAVATQFKGAASFTSRDDVNYTAALHAEGRDTGGRGNAAAEITARAEALSATSTRVEVIADLHITGKVAQFGRGILGDVSKKLMTQFATNLNAMLDEAGPAVAGSSNATASDSASDSAPDSTADNSAPDSAADTTPPETTPAAPEAPKIRKIDGPASEPIDMAGMAGPALAKRFGPILVVLVVALLLLRRRGN
jgi:carbon monoxide dehydrogenase subunit G